MYWANLCHGFIWYLSRLIYPQGIVMAWAAPLIHDHMAGYLWESSLLLILVSILYGRLAKECQLAFLWMIVGFMPVCVAAFRKPENGVQIEPHWFIFSSIGFFILMAYLLWVFLDKKKGFGLMLLFILTCTWGTISHANNQLWADQKTYSLYWSREVPSIKWINYYIASAYYDEGKLKESMRYLKRGLSGYPSDAELYLCMGVIEDGEHNFKAAESDDYRALESNPRSSFAYNNLAEIYLEEGQWEKAKALFHLALAYNPLMLDARVGLATIYFNHGQYQEANQLCQFNLSITKDDPQSLSLLMDICLRQKDFLNLRKYAKIFINAGSDPKALTVLGIVLAQQNIPDLALDSFSKVMRIAPDYKDGYVATGTLFANLGKYDEAIHIWKIGLTIDPADQRLRSDVNRAIKMNKSHVQS